MGVSEAVHTNVFSNVLAALVFFSPCFLFYFLKLYEALVIYDFVIIFLLTASISNLKWNVEIDKKHYISLHDLIFPPLKKHPAKNI